MKNTDIKRLYQVNVQGTCYKVLEWDVIRWISSEKAILSHKGGHHIESFTSGLFANKETAENKAKNIIEGDINDFKQKAESIGKSFNISGTQVLQLLFSGDWRDLFEWEESASLAMKIIEKSKEDKNLKFKMVLK